MELRASLRHPNVINFFGITLALHAPLQLVTELCEGSIRDLVRWWRGASVGH